MFDVEFGPKIVFLQKNEKKSDKKLDLSAISL